MHHLAPNGGVLLNRWPRVVVARQHLLGVYQLCCLDGVGQSHGVTVSDGQHSQMDIHVADQIHVTEQRGVTGKVYFHLIDGQHEASGHATVGTVG